MSALTWFTGAVTGGSITPEFSRLLFTVFDTSPKNLGGALAGTTLGTSPVVTLTTFVGVMNRTTGELLAELRVELLAVTLISYSLPSCKFKISQVSSLVVQDRLCPPPTTSASAVYEVIGDPPFDTGALHEAVAEVPDTFAVTPVGALGFEAAMLKLFVMEFEAKYP